MPRTLMPTPDLPRPDLATHLPVLRQMLEEQRRFRLDQLVELGQQDSDSSGSPYATGSIAGVDTAREEVTAALTAAARSALRDVESALARMDTGRYGMCLRCGTQISLDRLSVLPQTSLCAGCQRRNQPRR
jgi:DnaK suppressor protein